MPRTLLDRSMYRSWRTEIQKCNQACSTWYQHTDYSFYGRTPTLFLPNILASVNIGTNKELRKIGDIFIHIRIVLPAAISPQQTILRAHQPLAMPMPPITAIPGIIALTVTPCSTVHQKPENAILTYSTTMRPLLSCFHMHNN